jgi:hypothetical protein
VAGWTRDTAFASLAAPSRLAAPTLPLALLILLSACGDGVPDPLAGPIEVEIDAPVQVVVPMESDLIGSVVELHVSGDGFVYLLDGLANGVHVVSPQGELVRTIGRQGQGPGELLRPAALSLFADSLIVKDVGNGRLQAFTLGGEPLGTRSLPGAYQGDIHVDGSVVRPTLGMDSVLAVIHSPDGEERARVGEVLAPPVALVNMARIREEIAQGEVPDIFLNTADVRFADDGGIWLVIPAAGLVERYDPTGRQLVSRTLAEPEFAAARERFIAANEEAEANRVFPLRYIRHLRPVGDALWLLLDTGPDGVATVLVLSGSGEIAARLRFPQVQGASHVAPTPDGAGVYFVLPDRAELVRVDADSILPGTG